MTSIIKADDDVAAAVVKPLAALRRAQASPILDIPVPDPRIAQLEQQVEQAMARAAALAEEAGAVRAERDRAYAEGERAGRTAGRIEADGREAERLEALGKGIEAALMRYEERLAAVESLARLLATESLKRVIGEDRDRIDLLGRMIDIQLRQIDAASIVRIEVSRADFPDDHALDALRARIGSRIRLDVLEEADPGDCVIVQMLGALDIGVGQQLGRLATLLGIGEIADEG